MRFLGILLALLALAMVLCMVVIPRAALASEPSELSANRTNRNPAVSTVLTPSGADESIPVAVPPPLPRAIERYETGNVLWATRKVLEFVAPALFLWLGWSARMRTLARRLGRRWFFSLAIYWVLISLLVAAASLPLDFYQGFIRPHEYGLSNQTLAKWGRDHLTILGLTLILGALFLWVPYLLFRKSPRRWWLCLGLSLVPVHFFMALIQPVAFDPLFNEVTRLKSPALEAKILSLADRAGIHGGRVFAIRKSVDTKTVNAYVCGFLGTKRIVLWDTALDKLNEHELLFVMGHEMGHYVLNHVVKGLILFSCFALAALYGVHRLAPLVIRRFGDRMGFHDLGDFASLPLLVLLLNLFSLVLTPIGFAYSRHIEHEADRFGLELTHYNHSAATGFTRLQEENLSVPRPGWLYVLLRSTHPSIGDRIDFFNHYKPWEHGRPSRYEEFFPPAGSK